MDLKKLGFEIGVGGYGLNDEYMADIKVIGITDGIIACQASDKPTAERLRQYVLDVLQHAKTAATTNMGRLYMSVPEGSDMAVTYKGQHYPLLDLLAKAETLQAEIDQLRQQLHDHDRRRDASMELARTLAEGVDAVPSFDWKDAPEWAGALVCNVTNELFLWVEKYYHRDEGHEGKIKCQVATGRYPMAYVFMEQSHGWQLVSTRPTPNHFLIADELRKLADDLEPAGCRECFGFEHLDCICHDEHKPCMDIDGANLGLDSGNAPA